MRGLFGKRIVLYSFTLYLGIPIVLSLRYSHLNSVCVIVLFGFFLRYVALLYAKCKTKRTMPNSS